MTAAAESDDGDGESVDGNDVKLTLEALEAMSSSDDSDYAEDGEADDVDDCGIEGDEYDAEATALREMIQAGKFDALLKKHAKKEKKSKKKKVVEEVVEEVALEADEASVEEEHVADAKGEEGEDPDKDESESDSESDSGEAGTGGAAALKNDTQSLALVTAVQEADRRLPWAETFAMVPPTPLPFGPVGGQDQDGGDGEGIEEGEKYVDVHDDLKREVAFYDTALEAATLARGMCEEEGIPFARPDDFFAEMVKSDDHMAKIKDRLIFETKKMEAVERRKSNKEQTVMAKERRAHRLAEKAKAKKAHMSAVEDW